MYKLSSRSIPLNTEYDVIVIGGGPSGCTAAIAAAREGAKTILMEATSVLGGMGTSGLVPAWCPFSDKERFIYSGLAKRIFEQSKAPSHLRNDRLDWQAIDSELLKRIYDNEVKASGADILFGTMLCDVEKAGDTSVGEVIVCNKAGLSAYSAKVFIDCTGDGDLAFRAGADTVKGDETGDVQPSSLCFILSNVDEYGYYYCGTLHGGDRKSVIYDIFSSGKYPIINSSHLCASLIGPSTVGFNAGHIWDVDSTEPVSLTGGLIQGRKLAAAYRDALAEFFPRAFGNAFLVSSGSLLGVRESRRVTGTYVLDIQDYIARRSFDDEICRNSYYIDIHFNKKDEARQHKGEIEIDQNGMQYGRGESHGIPYRCLCPQGLDNVLVAGRAISCDRAVQGSIRVMPVCLSTGEAAGTAAAIAAREQIGIHSVNTGLLRSRLRENGAYLP